MCNEKMTKVWSKCQIKGQCLYVFNHHVYFFKISVVSVKHWSAMLMLSKDCGTQREREAEWRGSKERPENVAPYFE